MHLYAGAIQGYYLGPYWNLPFHPQLLENLLDHSLLIPAIPPLIETVPLSLTQG